MARMIPQLSQEQLRSFKSRAEARFYEACRDGLPDDVVVIYSSNWLYKDLRGKINEGEADFTVLSPQRGVLAVEVKGGGITFVPETGSWHSVDRNGFRHLIKDPFKQASNERHALLDQISGHSLWRQWTGGRFTIGHAVMFPDILDFKPLLGSDRKREIIGVSSDVASINKWYEWVTRFWHEPNNDELGQKGVRLIEDILCKSIDIKPLLRTAVDDVENQRIRLTSNQAKILRIIGGRRRAVISGGAGTGKTVLAVEKAKALANEGLSVLLLCYNRPLADSLATGLIHEPLIRSQSYHQLCDLRIRQAKIQGHDLLNAASEAYPGSGQQHHFDIILPYALALSSEVLDEKFDAVIVDEAQDFSDEYWFGIEMLLKDQENGYLYIFIDENQTIYPRKSKLPVVDDPFFLTNNCRNTTPIHDVGYSFYSGIQIDPPELIGPAVIWKSLENSDDQANAIAHQVNQWVNNDGLMPEDVAVLIALSQKSFAYELLAPLSGIANVKWAVEHHGKPNSVLIDTVGRFKGMEAQAIVLWIGDEIISKKQWETVYVGITRAKSLLTIVGSQFVINALRVRVQ